MCRSTTERTSRMIAQFMMKHSFRAISHLEIKHESSSSPIMKTTTALGLLMAAAALAAHALAEQCGSQAGGALCPDCLCCSRFGWCGSTSDYCGDGCQSQCDGCGGGGGGGAVESIVSKELFEQLLLHRNNAACSASGFYTYDAFVTAAAAFPDFAATGDDETRKREVAAFLAQTSHETTGGWPTAPDSPFSWGYCFKEEIGATADYCQLQLWAGGRGHRRGPPENPELVATDPVVSFKTALWFWMTPQAPKPSCHDVITGEWEPTTSDNTAGRVPGYGVITNIINGGLECGHGPDDRMANRIGFYQRYCDVLGIGYGSNLDCYDQRPFNSGLHLVMIAARAAKLVAMKAMALGVLALAYAAATARAEQCGWQAGGAVCHDNLCCSMWGWCGLGRDYCNGGCQSQCGSALFRGDDVVVQQGGGRVGGVASVVTGDLFDRMLPHRDDASCPARGFYTYRAFVAAAAAFPAFAATGDNDTRKREVAAFLAQTSHATSGGPYSCGYCYKEVKGATSDFCVPNARWPCAPGKAYHARGPMQIAYNYNYGAAGEAIGADLLGNPELVATDPTVAFKTALWLWMTPPSPRSPSQPSCHAVSTGQWTPTTEDRAAGRAPGYGLTTNILTGGLQCAAGGGGSGAGRVAFYRRYCDVLGVSYGPNLDCSGQAPFDEDIVSSAAGK
uniref:chitinase n=1 Tax=Leersia perrieri TaxID=77586 RepID=A0A0D9WG96_9ORYZ